MLPPKLADAGASLRAAASRNLNRMSVTCLCIDGISGDFGIAVEVFPVVVACVIYDKGCSASLHDIMKH